MRSWSGLSPQKAKNMYTRTDGEFEVYTIQVRHTDLSWGYCVGGSLGMPPKTTDDFSACGECWQKTGHHGVFDFNAGLNGLRWFEEKHKSHTFRMVAIRVRQYTTEIATDQSKTCRRCFYFRPYHDHAGQCSNPQVIGSASANRMPSPHKSEGFTGGVHPEGWDVEGVSFHEDFGCRYWCKPKE